MTADKAEFILNLLMSMRKKAGKDEKAARKEAERKYWEAQLRMFNE